ncbi:unnamed protein product [Lepidochelys kempii]
MLWYWLNTLVPAPDFLANLQKLILEFFWSGLHWVSAGVLHLLLEEGGQGLKCLRTQVHVFRLQALQRLFYGAGNPAWSILAHAFLRRFQGLRYDRQLLYLHPRGLPGDLSGLPVFYQDLPPDLETVHSDQVRGGLHGGRSPRGAPATQPPAPCAGGGVPLGAPEVGPGRSHQSQRPP